jgi:hypothetical protein
MRQEAYNYAGEPVLASQEVALRAFYGAKVAAVRRTTPSRDLSAALRVLFDEKRAALRELVERRHALNAATRLYSKIENSVRRAAEQRAQPM